MGNGVTKQSLQSAIQAELGKPVDASDVITLQDALAEIRKFRSFIQSEYGAGGGSVGAAGAAAAAGKKPPNRRGEVSAEVNEHGSNVPPYEKKVVAKSDASKKLISDAIHDNVLFIKMADNEKVDAVDAFSPIDKSAGTQVIAQGDQGDHFYVVEFGSLVIKVAQPGGGRSVRYGDLGPGDCFGELALMYNTPRAATIEATSDCKLWCLDRITYRSIVQHFEIEHKKQNLEFLKNVPLLRSLLDREFSRLQTVMEEEVYQPGEVIVRQGEKGDHFYIISRGEVDVFKTPDEGGEPAHIAVRTRGDYFGEKALKTEDTRKATCIAKTNVACLSISRDVFNEVLGKLQELEDRTVREETKEEAASAAGSAGMPPVAEHRYGLAVGLADLEVKQTLGCGAFGRVKLVKHAASGSTYALKCLAKADVVSNNLQGHVLNERAVMMQLDQPFILKMHNSYKDAKFIYFLLEVCLGGEMFTYLRKAGRFQEAWTRFYAASVVLAFQHMHSKKICYRDLKPENLCLDHRGFLKVVDFGLAKFVSDKTWTLCGTPDYLAPEIILSKGHDMAVDYWALGVLVYEMTAGFVPFYSDDPMEVYQLILADDVRYPAHFSRAASDLISKLLSANQSKRLGNTKTGVQGIIKHKWFSGFDWDGLLNMTLTPPIVPVVNGAEDASNFDDYPEEQETVVDCPWDPEF